MFSLKRFLPYLVSLLLCSGVPAYSFVIISDAELENTLNHITEPLLKAAEKDGRELSLQIILDHNFNAFVAEGQKIFIFTGLFQHLESAGELQGIIAHELGHIQGGHLSRLDESAQTSSAIGVFSILSGMALMTIGGNTKLAEAGAAIAYSGSELASRSFLRDIRHNEGAADQFALTILEKAQLSGIPYLKAMERIRDISEKHGQSIPEYLLTHPHVKKRLQHIEVAVKDSSYHDTPTDQKLQTLFARSKAKVYAFTNSYKNVFRHYNNQQTIQAQYAKAIASYRAGYYKDALQYLSSLLKQFPEDPYFLEFSIDLFIASNQPQKALKAALFLLKVSTSDSPVRLQVASALIKQKDYAYQQQGATILHELLGHNPNSVDSWRLLSVFYGRDGRLGKSYFCNAMRFFYMGNMIEARKQAFRAFQHLPKDSPERKQLQDLLKVA